MQACPFPSVLSVVGVTVLVLSASCPVLADHPTVGVGANQSGPITTSTARTLDAGQAAVALDFQYIDFDPVSDARLALGGERDEDIHSADSLTRSALNFAYGVSDKLTLGFSLPYIERKGLKEAVHDHEQEHEGDHGEEPEGGHHSEAVELDDHHEAESDHGQIESLGDAGGFGDAQFYGAYQIRSETDDGLVALLFGIKVPSGDTHQESRAGERLETELQPGSGSWDPFLGLAYSRSLGVWALDSNVLYTLVGEGSQRTDLGDILNYNLSLSYPLGLVTHAGHDDHNHHHASAGSALRASLIFEINGEWRDRTEIAGRVEKHSGGNLLYFSPGLSIQARDWLLSAAVSIPFENLNGAQSEPETRLVFRVGRAF